MMLKVSQFIDPSIHASMDFIYEQQLSSIDKKSLPQLAVSALACARLGLLAAHWQERFPSVLPSRIHLIPLGLYFLESTVGWAAKSYVKKHETAKPSVLTNLCHLIGKLSDHSSNLRNQKLNHMITIASVISCVALIALGAHIEGGVGLAGLALTGLHKLKVLPEGVDTFLGLVVSAIVVYYQFFSLVGILTAYSLISKAISKGRFWAQKQYPDIAKRLLRFDTHPFEGLFKIKNPILVKQMDSFTEFNLGCELSFRPNRSAFYALEKEGMRGKIFETLKVLRGEIVVTGVKDKLYPKIIKLFDENAFDQKILGDDEKILTQMIHKCIWHRFPTEQSNRMSRSFVEILLCRYLAKSVTPQPGFLDDLIINYTFLNLSMISFVRPIFDGTIGNFIMSLESEYSAEKIIDCIHQKVQKNEISIDDWKAEIQTRIKGIDFTLLPWKEEDGKTSIQTIRLLLWDIGVIKSPYLNL